MSDERLDRELRAIRANARRGREEHRRLLEGRLSTDPERDVAQLDGNDPIVLLPVRLETRFERRAHLVGGTAFAGVLKVRIYPDAIAANAHEPRLTENERDAGFDYWRKAWRDAGEADAWSALIEEIAPPRAAWVVKQTTPTNHAADFPQAPGANGREPAFPAVDLRPPNWQRHPSTDVLPDRWVVLAYRNDAVVGRAVSAPVAQPLALTMTFSSDEDAAETIELSNGLRIDQEIAWTVQFQEALVVGMAVELPVTETDFSSGFQQVLVIGVKSSLAPADAGKRLGELIDSHHYSRGFSFVPQGAATNNVSDAPSWFPRPDPRGQNTFRVERGAALVAADVATDGTRFMRALGIAIDHAAHVEGADRDEQRTARAMAEALWPCTLGYFLEHMMHPVVGNLGVQNARNYALDHVRGRGSYPAFRVGEVPYGLLPVTSLDDWDPADEPLGVERELKPLLLGARSLFSSAVGSAPRVNRGADADQDLLETLGMDASARQVWIRRVLGRYALWNFARFSGLDADRVEATLRAKGDDIDVILEDLEHPEWDPPVFHTNFSDPPFRFAKGLVVNDPEDPLSEAAALEFNYITWLRTAGSITAIRDQSFPAGLEEPPQSLLYLMLRHAALQQYTRSALDILVERRLANPSVLRERELIGITAQTRDAPTVWQHLEKPVPGLTAGKPIDAVLGLGQLDPQLPPIRDLEGYRAALEVLENLPTAELERLFTETLDVHSHRVDAWTTAMAARRLGEMRQSNPSKCHLAAYGWVEDLQADRPSRGAAADRDGRRVLIRDDSAGYVYAPSMTHGAAAAVLLNAYLTRQGAERDRYAVNLSSRRTRLALEVIDAVRNGQPLGAVLGYRFERGLHEGHPGVELDRFIDDFRRDYPVGRNEARDSNEAAESVVARNVVDGLALRLAWRGEPGFTKRPWETIAASPEQRAAVLSELAKLDETVDAVADFLLADSVFQMVSGKMDAAGASLKAVGEGARPPEGDIARTPRSGTALTHRVALVLGGEPLDIQATWPGPRGERARAEPHLNGWVGRMLGDPSTVRCEVRFDSGVVQSVTLNLLNVDPLDVLALARGAESTSEDSELDRRVRLAAGAAAPADDRFMIRYEPETLAPGERSFALVLEVARSLNQLLGAGKPLSPRDLVPPEQESDLRSDDPAIAPDMHAGELQARAASARTRLDQRRAALGDALAELRAVPPAQPAVAELDAVRAALRKVASFGIAGAYPRTFAGATSVLRADLEAQAASVLDEASRRVQLATDGNDPVEQLKALFGRDFVVLSRFRPARPPALQAAIAQPPDLGANGPATYATWFAQAARVRNPLALLRRVQQYARALDAPPDVARVAQVPASAGARWVGLPFADEADRPPRGLTSLILHGVPSPPADQPWTGLLLDEWMESIPSVDEDAGIVFHHDSPGAEAPQAVLIAVPPSRMETWNFGLLVKILRQTLFDAKVRAVDRDNAKFTYGQALPMIYLAQNTRHETVSTQFTGEVLKQAFFFQGGG